MGSLAAQVCIEWDPNPHQMQHGLIVECMNCGGEWGQHALSPLAPSGPAPRVRVKFGTASGPVNVTGPTGATMQKVWLRRVMEPGNARSTLGFGAVERTEVHADGTTTTGYENVAVVIDTNYVPRIAERLATLTGQGGVEAWVPVNRIIIREPRYALYPAVYVGDTVTVPGMQPTLIRGQGVVVVGPVEEGGSTHRVRYDPTDLNIGSVQWTPETVITDIPGDELVSNANWRWWGGADPAWLLKPTWVASSIVPGGPDPMVTITQP